MNGARPATFTHLFIVLAVTTLLGWVRTGLARLTFRRYFGILPQKRDTVSEVPYEYILLRLPHSALQHRLAAFLFFIYFLLQTPVSFDALMAQILVCIRMQ